MRLIIPALLVAIFAAVLIYGTPFIVAKYRAMRHGQTMAERRAIEQALRDDEAYLDRRLSEGNRT